MKRVAIFGGTFDPIHLGHLEMAQVAREKSELDRVIFMPCLQSPFKGRAAASGRQRHEMIKLALAGKGFDDWAEVSDFEISQPGPSFSWKTVEHFRELAGSEGTRLNWILGTDQWDQIDRWARADYLRDALHFIVFTRCGSGIRERDGYHYQAIEFSHPASATRIREEVEKCSKWLPGSVYQYIREQDLYNQNET